MSTSCHEIRGGSGLPTEMLQPSLAIGYLQQSYLENTVLKSPAAFHPTSTTGANSIPSQGQDLGSPRDNVRQEPAGFPQSTPILGSPCAQLSPVHLPTELTQAQNSKVMSVGRASWRWGRIEGQKIGCSTFPGEESDTGRWKGVTQESSDPACFTHTSHP